MAALYLRPDADQSDGSWLDESSSGTNLFASVDEATTPSDSDYIQSSTTVGDKVRLQISDPGTAVSQPMIVRYRAKRGSGLGGAGVIGRLFESTTQRATWTQAVDDTLTTYTYTLTSGEFTSIGNFNNLFVEFEYAAVWWLANASMDLSFTTSQYYDSSVGDGQAVTTYLSCTRASTGFAKTSAGTLTSFASNALRITDLGLLIEDARINLVPDSQNLPAASFITITNNVAAAPDGTTTAASMLPGNVGPGQAQRLGITIGSGIGTGSYTTSIFFKDGTGAYDNAFLTLTDGTNSFGIILDVTTGTITQTNTGGSPTGTASSVEAYGNSWYRASVTMNGTSGTLQQCSGPFNAATAASWHASGLGPLWATTADGTSTGLAWGAQIELGAFASSYMPTSGGTFSRAADALTTSSSLQTVINAATGSLVAQVDNGAVAGVAANIVDSNGTNLLGFNASNNALASITATLATGNTANRTTQDKLGLAWAASARSLVLNGGTVATDTSSQTPSATQHIGSSGSVNFANAYVERLTAWTTKLANATLQGLTT